MRRARLLATAAVLGCEAILVPAAAHLVALPVSGTAAVRACAPAGSDPWAAEGSTTAGTTYYELRFPSTVSRPCEFSAYPQASFPTGSLSEVTLQRGAASQLMVGVKYWGVQTNLAIAPIGLGVLTSSFVPEPAHAANGAQYRPVRVCCEPYSVPILPFRSGTAGANESLF